MKILVFAPHPDDEILGCGGTMARYIDEGAEITVCVCTCGHPPVFDDSLMKKMGWPHTLYPEITESHRIIGVKDTIFLPLPCVTLETEPRYKVNGLISDAIQKVRPDVVFIPHFGDMQKDHTIIAEAVMVAVRPKYAHHVQLVYSYETLSETEWNIPHVTNSFIPNVFVNIEKHLSTKLAAMSCYKSQLGDFPDPRSLEAVESLAKLRGSTMGAKAAEAFMLIREYRG